MKPLKIISILVLLAAMLAACSNLNTPGTAAVETSLPPTESIPPTAEPSPTPEPLPRRAILVAGQADAWLQEGISQLAEESDLAFETRPSLAAAELSEDVVIVVFQGVPDDLAGLANAAPNTQFVVIAQQDVTLTANVSLIRSHPEFVYFAAGYLTAISAPDWRAGALLPDNGALGASAQDAFINGARYWCGRCAPTYGPVVLFPLVGMLPTGSPAASWQTAFDVINDSRIEVLYVASEAASAELFAALLPQGVILSGSVPPEADVRARWAATVLEDAATPLQTLWPDLLAGQGGQTLTSSVRLQDVNADLLTPGRQERVQGVIDLLTQGLINPFSVPE